MRKLFLLGILLLLMGCRPDIFKPLPDFPDPENLLIRWRMVDDAVNRNNLRTQIISIVNNDSVDFPDQDWALYYNQLPGSIYLDPADESRIRISSLGGDFYKIEPGEAFQRIPPGTSFDINYRMPLHLIKTTHYPHGFYFTIGNGEEEQVIKISNYQYEPLPGTIIAFGKNDQSVFISGAQRYDENEYITDIPIAELIPIIPTPRKCEKKPGEYILRSNVKVHYDQGLRNEADFLAGILNQVLLPAQPNPTDSSLAEAIFLRLDPPGMVNVGGESYTLEIDPVGGIEITGSDPAGVFYGIQSLRLLLPPDALNTPTEQMGVPAIQIQDSPMFPYRGLHLDLARNFHEPFVVQKIIDLMALYKLNKLHLHLTDDEGWRLEIPGLPELTEVGARRGHPNTHDPTLPPAYGSGPDPDPVLSTGSGYLSRNEFIALLQFAEERHIEVIPEINGPGHARAAIKSMQVRHERLQNIGQDAEAREYLLHDPNDKSQYTSAQNYHDNVMCVCQEYTYTFLEKVVAEIVKMYEEADVALTTIHIGGDEVPGGAWEGSPECDRFIREEPTVSSVGELFPYFVRRFNTILSDRGLLTAGWEEIAIMGSTHVGSTNAEPNPEFVGKGVIPYVWNTLIGQQGEDLGYQLANAGFRVVMCNASNFYFDFSYTREPEEPGLYWGGLVDTRNAFEMSPYDLFKTVFYDDEGNPVDGQALSRGKVALKPDARKNILGLQGQIWSETLKDPNMVEYYMIPKFFGLAERAWVGPPPWMSYGNPDRVKRSLDVEWARFANRIGKIQMPRLDLLNGGYYYRIPPPGARLVDDMFYANIAFPGLEIRYTVDGSDPNPYSDLYSGPVAVDAGQTIKLRAFSSKKRASRLVEVN